VSVGLITQSIPTGGKGSLSSEHMTDLSFHLTASLSLQLSVVNQTILSGVVFGLQALSSVLQHEQLLHFLAPRLGKQGDPAAGQGSDGRPVLRSTLSPEMTVNDNSVVLTNERWCGVYVWSLGWDLCSSWYGGGLRHGHGCQHKRSVGHQHVRLGATANMRFFRSPLKCPVYS